MYLQHKQTHTGHSAAEVRLSISTPAAQRWTVLLYMGGQIAPPPFQTRFKIKIDRDVTVPDIDYASSHAFPNNKSKIESTVYKLTPGYWRVENNSGVPVHIEFKPIDGHTFIEA
jgi:hypothetical protein